MLPPAFMWAAARCLCQGSGHDLAGPGGGLGGMRPVTLCRRLADATNHLRRA